MTITPIKEIAGALLNEEQTTYLTGFFAGMQQRAGLRGFPLRFQGRLCECRKEGRRRRGGSDYR